MRGLNYNIANIVELYPYSDFDTLCGLCLKLESQGKMKYGGGSSMEYGKTKTWSRPESSPKPTASFSNPFGSPSTGGSSHSPIAPKMASSTKETSLSKVRCFKCQGFGHYQNACPNKRVVTLREAIECLDELFEDEEMMGDTFGFGDGNEDEEESYEAPIHDTTLVLRTLQTQVGSSDSDQ